MTKKNDLTLRNIIVVVITFFIGSFLFIAPYYKALFMGGSSSFDRPIFISIICCAIVLLLYALLNMKDQEIIRVWDIRILVWLIPFTYLSASLFNAASNYFSWFSVNVHIFYAVAFLIGIYLANNNKATRAVEILLYLSAYSVVIHGLLNWFGQLNYQEAILGYRLSGVFQYPNAYAAFLVGIYFATLNKIMNLQSWKRYLPYTLMLVPILISLLFTLSRG